MNGALIDLDDLSQRQRRLVRDVLVAAEVLVHLEPTEYQAQDDGLVELRDTWRRLEQSLPGATTVFAAPSVVDSPTE